MISLRMKEVLFKIKRKHINITLNKKILYLYIILGICAILACSYLYFHSPFEKNIYPRCIFRTVFGLYCPGCGATRATYELIHGNLIEALKYNSLYVVSIPFVIYLLILFLDIKINGESLLPALSLNTTGVIVLVIIIFAYWIFRNINIYPFKILAP